MGPPTSNADAGRSVQTGRRFVWLLYGTLAAIALGIALLNLALDYQRTRDELAQRVEAYGQSMALDVRWYVEVARQSLSRVIEKVAQTEPQHYSDVLASATSDLPDGVVIAIYDAAGKSLAFMGLDSGPVEVADRVYFQELRGGRSWVISNLLADRVTGTKTFAVGLRIHDADGAFRGAAIAYAPMRVFSEAWLAVGGDASNAFLVHEEGWLTARLPPLDSEVYDRPVSAEFVASFTGQPSGAYWAPVSPIDGIVRVLGYARVPGTPLVAVIGVNPEEQLVPFWRRAAVVLGILSPILVALGIASWRITTLMGRQEATARQLSASSARNEQLLLEIHHRIKNNLQSVMSLVRTQVRDPAIVAGIAPRISAMAAVHEHLYKHVDFSAIRAPEYIDDIARKVIYASANNLQLKTDIADVELPNRIVMPVGQLVNEAIINAAKYGYPDGKAGTIDIRMSVDQSGMASLTIHNDGAPLPADRRDGLGSRLMSAFAAQMSGTVDITSDATGVTVRTQFPLQPS
ncbi:MAG: hypothetical protein EOP22_19570 [Hyphomicrobiales bacterium]|nr:MAG: hypothetical protein EOP22_19570 [Hyphomicrobiales bacterium]